MLNIGDVVNLYSGSPAMTVVKDLNNGLVRTVWFVEGMPIKHEFPKDALKKHD